MAYELKENQVTIFKNKHKKAENQPDYKGQVNIDGEIKEIALWVKEGKSEKFFSGKISEKREKQEPKKDSMYENNDLPF